MTEGPTDRPTGEPREEPADADDAEASRRRARRRAEVFGDVLPESTRDDRDPQAPRDGDSSEEWLKRNVPPHHG